MVANHPELFGSLVENCYDLQSTLFSKRNITENDEGKNFDFYDPLITEKLPGARVQVKVKPVKG